MRYNDETTATQLQALLATRNVYVSLSTIVRNRLQLGWIYRGSAYSQLIRPRNVEKRLLFAQTCLHETFDDVIWSDETTIQLEIHKIFCYREKPRLKPRAKHPTKVHVWAGISKKGPTSICIFEGINGCTALHWHYILKRTLIPFIQSHRFMQDNDPKHTSRAAQQFYQGLIGGKHPQSHPTWTPSKTCGMSSDGPPTSDMPTALVLWGCFWATTLAYIPKHAIQLSRSGTSLRDGRAPPPRPASRLCLLPNSILSWRSSAIST